MHEVTLVLIWILRTSVDDLVLVVQVWFWKDLKCILI